MPYLRTNWKLTSANLPKSGAEVNILESMLVQIRQTAQLASAGAYYPTFSMAGYGRPGLAIVQLASDHQTFFQIRASVAAAASVVYVTLLAGSSVCLVSLAATVSYPFFVMALIASR